jgi:hypothetical protein
LARLTPSLVPSEKVEKFELCVFTSPLEPILARISERRQLPRRRSLTLAAKQNNPYHFPFARATKNSSKRKRVFCLTLLFLSKRHDWLRLAAASKKREKLIKWK